MSGRRRAGLAVAASVTAGLACVAWSATDPVVRFRLRFAAARVLEALDESGSASDAEGTFLAALEGLHEAPLAAVPPLLRARPPSDSSAPARRWYRLGSGLVEVGEGTGAVCYELVAVRRDDVVVLARAGHVRG